MPPKIPPKLMHSCAMAVKAVERHFTLKGQSPEAVKAALALRKDLESRHSALMREIKEKGINEARISKSKRMNALLARLDFLIRGNHKIRH